MRKIYTYCREHFRAEFYWPYYLLVSLLLLALVSAEEYYDVAQKVITQCVQTHNPLYVFVWMALYGGVYYGTLALYGWFKQDFAWAKSRTFWLKTGLVILALSLYSTSWLHVYVLDWFSVNAERNWIKRVAIITQLNVLFLLPALLFYIRERRDYPFLYGITTKGFDYKMYLPVILMVLVIVGVSASSPHFSSYYPLCKPEVIERFETIPKWFGIISYESLYASAFFCTELLFRGLLVVGLSRTLGEKAILPMAVLYCTIHFNKPFGETLSSFVGGYVLGILAARTQNILGGIWVHLTLAMGMEVLGWVIYYYF